MNNCYTILGAGGAIGIPLAKVLFDTGKRVRLVSRAPKSAGRNEELVVADLLKESDVIRACDQSEVVFLLAGMHYSAKVWEVQWPVVMRNTIIGCKASGARLVFFDNVYPYGLVNGPMTEATPYNPCSRKGEVRARIATDLMIEVKNGFQALIARSADFYGPNVKNSITESLIFQRIKAGKSGQWFCDADLPHSLTFTPDAASATALLGSTLSAFGQTWHLPTAAPALTGREFIEKVAEVYGNTPKVQIFSKAVLTLGGLFVEVVRESKEMLYQYDHPYHFDSSKFVKCFHIDATSYANGIQASICT